MIVDLPEFVSLSRKIVCVIVVLEMLLPLFLGPVLRMISGIIHP